MEELTSENIELINAYGPYNHAVWSYGNSRITNEEKLEGRVDLLVRKIRESILEQFTLDELKKMSIVDVGCYDGWILQQLSDLPFAEIIGIEPRANNIAKAYKIRELLAIQSRIRFKQGDVDSLGDERFDIVICTGVLHHLDSMSSAIRKLRSACNKMLFVETICLSSKYMSKDFREEMELKDIIYFNRNALCGMTGQKFESAYYDGSANETGVVSIPSIETLIMHLETEGFTNIKTVIPPEMYRQILEKNRKCNEVMLSAIVDDTPKEMVSDEFTWIQDYETGLMDTLLDKDYIEPLYRWTQSGKFQAGSLRLLNSYLYIRLSNRLARIFLQFQRFWFKDRYEKEIVKNMRFNPGEKIALEYGKILYSEREYQKAIGILKKVTGKLNADWRSVYRSFYLLSMIYEALGDEAESERYRELCLTCNAKYPVRVNAGNVQ